MTLLRWRQKDVGLSVADEITRANVERAMQVISAHKSYDYRKGYERGKTDGLLIGFALAGALAGIGALLMGVLS